MIGNKIIFKYVQNLNKPTTLPSSLLPAAALAMEHAVKNKQSIQAVAEVWNKLYNEDIQYFLFYIRGGKIMNIIQAENYQQMSELAAKKLIEQVNRKSDSVLGLATGSTPEGLYEEIIKEHKEGNVSFKDVTTFNLDEYVGLSKDNDQSYYYYMHKLLFDHIDLKDNQANLPNGDAEDLQEECSRYEASIQQAGGIDIQILGIGLNGHIGFNEPGTPFSIQTHIVDLDESTRNANARFFDSIDEVPLQAITMGIDSIMQTKQIILLVSGSKKAGALEKLVNGPVTEDFPASILQKHPNVTIIADREALAELSQ